MVKALRTATQLLRVVSAQGLSTYANQVVAFVIPWLVLSQTGSAADAGFVAFAMGAAAFIGIFLGGFVTDRIGGKTASIIADSLSLVTAIVLAATLFFGIFELWIVIVTQVIGVFFDGPGQIAKNTLVPSTAKHDGVPLTRAMGLTHTLQNIAMFVGPLSAGVLIVLISESGALLLAGLFFLLCVLLIARFRLDVFTTNRSLSVRQGYHDFLEAITFLKKEPFLGPMQLFGPFFAFMMPIGVLVFSAWFNLDGQSSGSLGLFLGIQALGGIFGGVAYTVWGPRVSQRKWLVVSTIMYTLLLGGLSLVQPSGLLALVLGFMCGLSFTGMVTIPYAAFYARAPRDLLGRLNSIGAALASAVGAILALFFGWLIDATSGATALVACAIGMSLITLGTLTFPFIKLLDKTHVETTNVTDSGG